MPSESISLVSTLPETGPPSSIAVLTPSSAVGKSLTPVTVIVTVAISVLTVPASVA